MKEYKTIESSTTHDADRELMEYVKDGWSVDSRQFCGFDCDNSDITIFVSFISRQKEVNQEQNTWEKDFEYLPLGLYEAVFNSDDTYTCYVAVYNNHKHSKHMVFLDKYGIGDIPVDNVALYNISKVTKL